MIDDTRASYDDNAELYASLFLGELDRDRAGLKWLARFAELARQLDGVVADLGCGPGHVVNHLYELGLCVVGYDISPATIAQARAAFPHLRYEVGDFGALDIESSSLAGIVARYSIIHAMPTELGEIFREWFRILAPGAPLLVSFFGALTPDAHGTPFDHKVVTAYALFPETIATELEHAGFVDCQIEALPPIEGGRPFSRGRVLARR